jgi:RND family efflux transporter MFP subunit
MSLFRQILLSVLVIVIAGAGWLAFERRDLIFGAVGAAADAGGGGQNGSAGAGSGNGGANRQGGGGGGGLANAGSGGSQGGGQGGSGGQSGGGGGRGFGGPPQVVTAKVVLDSTGADIRAIGTLAAAQEVTIFPQVTGVVSDVAFKRGAKVGKGDTLVKLDDSDQKVAVDGAGITLDTAKAALVRAEKLAETKNISPVDLDTARAGVKKAEIDLRAAQLDLDKREIKAPFAGVTGLTDLSVGDLVTNSKAITTLDDVSTVTVSFQVAQRFAGMVAPGQEVSATSEALPGQTFAGRIDAIDNRIDPEARTLKVEASLPNESGTLKPGMAIVVMQSFAAEPHPSVPSIALQWDRKGSFVWKLDGAVVHRLPVQVITRRSGVVTVAADLKADDLVVTEGVLRLREGVTVARADQGGGPPAADAKDGEASLDGNGKSKGDGVTAAGRTPPNG